MHKSELPASPDLAIRPLPVVCERCKAQGAAGDDPFAAIPDILAFEPVPRRARADGWRPEHQRAFIAALALTGSPKQAARAIGKHEFGAQSLRKARGGRAFSEAWDAALELHRDREFARIRDNLGELAAGQEAALPSPAPGEPGPWVRRIYGDDYDPDEYLEGHADYVETLGSIRDRLLRARRLYLAAIAEDEASRAAWEVLVGPADWDKAERMEPQDDEPEQHPTSPSPVVPNLRGPDMILVASSGLMPDLAGGYDLLAEARQELERQQSGDCDES